jgi:DNA-binding NarL/FixJ family response regulator
MHNSTTLTHRERQTLELLAEGLYYKEVADKMDISVGNVKQKAHAIYQKLGVSNRTEAINQVWERGQVKSLNDKL